MFNPFFDHDSYNQKDPRSMSKTELQMLLKIKQQEVLLEWKSFQDKLQFWERLGKTIQKSGILESVSERLFSRTPSSTGPEADGSDATPTARQGQEKDSASE